MPRKENPDPYRELLGGEGNSNGAAPRGFEWVELGGQKLLRRLAPKSWSEGYDSRGPDKADEYLDELSVGRIQYTHDIKSLKRPSGISTGSTSLGIHPADRA